MGNKQNDRSNKLNARVISVLGGPGSGKGTQCEQIKNKYHFTHISVGELLREMQEDDNSPYSKIIRESMSKGTLMPTPITVDILLGKMETFPEGTIFLIDGFPRSVEQAEEFGKRFGGYDLIIVLECPEEVMQERLLLRGRSSKREDDNRETIVRRFGVYNTVTSSVIRQLEENTGKVRRIPTGNRPIDSIFLDIQKILDKYIEDNNLSHTLSVEH